MLNFAGCIVSSAHFSTVEMDKRMPWRMPWFVVGRAFGQRKTRNIGVCSPHDGGTVLPRMYLTKVLLVLDKGVGGLTPLTGNRAWISKHRRT